jgi:outer membrane protein assembly factor BamB
MGCFSSMRVSLSGLPIVMVLACGGSKSSAGPSDAAADRVLSDDASAESAADSGLSGASATANLLIADQFNNRVIEVTRAGEIVWTFGDGSSVPGPTSVVAPNDVERLPNGQTLIAGSGAAAGTEPTCTMGCPDNRVIIVDDVSGMIVWQYGEDGGGAGDGPDQLNTPVSAVLVPGAASVGDHILITDQGNNRIIEVDQTTKQIVWQFPPVTSTEDAEAGVAAAAVKESAPLGTGDAGLGDAEAKDAAAGDAGRPDASAGDAAIEGSGDAGGEAAVSPSDDDAGTPNQALNSPNSAERLANGHTLIADESNNRVIEVATDGTIVWQYPQPVNLALLNVAGFASRLANGNTLISDTNNNRIIEVTMAGTLAWTYSTTTPTMPAPQPSCAVRLANGDTLITNQFNDQVIEVTPANDVVFAYGQPGVAGSANGQLNTPYHAVDIGDYTGLTAPTP